MCDIDVRWLPRRIHWNVHAWTMMISLYYSVGVVDSSSRAMHLQEILHWAWTFLHRNYLDDSEGCSCGQLVSGIFIASTHSCLCIMSCAKLFVKTSNHLGDSGPLQTRLGALQIWWLLAFPKSIITFEREEISDHWWDSGKYDGAANGDWENCVRSQGA